MFCGKDPRGFTIVEVMVFLTVSGLLFLSAVALIGNSQSKTEFSSSVNITFTQLQNLANDVSNGYYKYPSNITCSGGTSSGSSAVNAPTVAYSSTGTSQGGNLGCTYIGEVIQFAPSNNLNEYDIIPLVGNQYIPGTTTTVTNLEQARPTALAPFTVGSTSGHELDAVRKIILPYGLQLGSIYYTVAGLNNFTTMFGFVSNFANTQTGTGQLQTGAQNFMLAPIPTHSVNRYGLYTIFPYNLPVWDNSNNSGIPYNGIFFASNFGISANGAKIVQNVGGVAGNDYLNQTGSTVTDVNPAGGLNICFTSPHTTQTATINIGANGNPSEMTLKIQGNTPCPT